MSAPLGFILLTHSTPLQIRRLVLKLNNMFDTPPIVCHHDFGQCALDEKEFPANVSFTHPHLGTQWARWSVVEATIHAMRQLFDAPNPPRKFALLSGADYPIKPAAKILHDLEIHQFDAYMTLFRVVTRDWKNKWEKEFYRRYYQRRIMYPALNKKLKPIKRALYLQHHRVPFSDEFPCYCGSQFFYANERAARTIIDFHENRHELADHFRSRLFPEESYFQTILMSTPGIKVLDNNWRYVDNSTGPTYPRELDSSDLPALVATSAHFARKFNWQKDRAILDELDKITA